MIRTHAHAHPTVDTAAPAAQALRSRPSMPVRLPALLGLLAGVVLPVALGIGAAHARSEYQGVTAIVAVPVSGGLSARADEPAGVGILVGEINAQRGKSWVPFRGPLSSCAVRLTLYAQDRRVARLVLDRNRLVEFASASDTTGVAREVGSSELGGVRRLVAKVKSQSNCR
jgi:hypothetical protein